MTRLRRDTIDPLYPPTARRLRVVASGTLFLTHTLSLQTYPAESESARAQAVVRARGGSASNVLCTLGQFPCVEAMLVAPLAGNEEGRMLMRSLEAEGVSTRYCKVWDGAGVPGAWVLQSGATGSRTVVNHNPLPDITHEEFVGLLGPLLVPENYVFNEPSSSSSMSASNPSSPPLSCSSPPLTLPPSSQSPAPFDWLHFEGRSIKTTLSNISGIDGLARERKWRSHCVFSLDVSRRSRQGVEALIPHADVVFFSKQYALSQSPNYTTPRPFLLSQVSVAAPHALLVVHWGASGAALLSLPTREYFQSSGWVEERAPPVHTKSDPAARDESFAVSSVRSGSGFWAAGHARGSATNSSGAYTALSSPSGGRERDAEDAGDADSQGTETGREASRPGGEADALDDLGAQDAFIAGMIYALSRRILPGAPYTPAARSAGAELDRGRWKLEDCLRFASELAGRKARRRSFGRLADEMMAAGWLDV